ncbi:MAG TPA: DCC1-like thiol-disulfide oxidoreductase family protein [Saprospiraceae bacterium]|nr:DCC1-like thiol-disulfide oxidoreductase family protein [Saprospiraceae bacterium]HMQ84241.1 DCC1-like thiol-disulfide oxidoreductase family protein [Saprospiraceae bacterium]
MKHWLSAWFTPIYASRLSLIRIASGAFMLWYLISRYDMMMKMVAGDADMYQPVGLAAFWTEPIPVTWFYWILNICILLNILFIVGWKHRFIAPVFAIAVLWLMCYRNSWSMIYHNYNILVLHILVIAFSSAADTLSIDRLIRHRQKQQSLFTWQTGWPIRLISVITVITYFLSGIAKVKGELAWEWFTGAAVRSQVAVDALRKDLLGAAATPMFEWLYERLEVFFIMGAGTMIVELGAPLALLHRKIGMIWAVLAILMHWGIYFIMGIEFPYHMSGFIFLSFFPVERLQVVTTVKAWSKDFNPVLVPGKHAVVLFDGECNVCNRWVRFIIKRDQTGYFRFASQQSVQGSKLLAHYQVDENLSSIILIQEGTAYMRSTAVLRIFRNLGTPWSLWWMGMIIPKIWRDKLYDLFARYRYTLFGKKEFCELPSLSTKNRFLLAEHEAA